MTDDDRIAGRDRSTVASGNGSRPESDNVVLYLFPDTNLFFQCLPLDQLPWSSTVECDEVHLIVCRPVQREIDNRKQTGNSRVARRARKAHTLFRRLILNNLDQVIIRDTKPLVLLRVEPSYIPDKSFSDRLDYNNVDDSIVGCAFAYRTKNPHHDARLLTHDSGAMATAKMLSLPFVPIPDEWIMPPERNDTERDIVRLKKELEELSKSEPRFAIRNIDAHGADIDSIQCERNAYSPLTDVQTDNLLETLKNEFPLATDFGPRDAAQAQSMDPLRRLSLGMTYFMPASEDDIDEYTNAAYPKWVERCREKFQGLHVSLEELLDPICFWFSIANAGSRPGKDVLVTITARGNFLIQPPRDEEARVAPQESLVLPSPPEIPRGRWQDFLREPAQLLGGLPALPSLDALRALDREDHRRDPNGFYYKPVRPEGPGESFSIECEQWRHGLGATIFGGELFVHHTEGDIRGVIECVVHAENLSGPIREVVRVKASAKQFSTENKARQLVAELCRRRWE